MQPGGAGQGKGKVGKKPKKICRFCLMMRLLAVFMLVVAIFVFNGLSGFFG